jgi:hypothetical protein
MIVVTGTKRSGTSMWMQVLQAAGIQTLGHAFSKTWEETIKDANKRGFYESSYRRGIYYATNPNPETGVWLPPRRTRQLGVKVFIPGVVRSDVIYLSRVIASVRPFRQYAASLTRLYEMERASHEKKGTTRKPSEHLDPILEWWLENFLLVRDITTRRYPVRLVSYESMIEDPEAICRNIFAWLEVGDAEAALRAVHPEDRTQQAASVSSLSHEYEDVFDEYHRRVKRGEPFDAGFLSKMNETHVALLPLIEARLHELGEIRRRRQLERAPARRTQGGPTDESGESAAAPQGPRRSGLNLDRIDALLHPIADD